MVRNRFFLKTSGPKFAIGHFFLSWIRTGNGPRHEPSNSDPADAKRPPSEGRCNGGGVDADACACMVTPFCSIRGWPAGPPRQSPFCSMASQTKQAAACPQRQSSFVQCVAGPVSDSPVLWPARRSCDCSPFILAQLGHRRRLNGCSCDWAVALYHIQPTAADEGGASYGIFGSHFVCAQLSPASNVHPIGWSIATDAFCRRHGAA